MGMENGPFSFTLSVVTLFGAEFEGGRNRDCQNEYE